MILAIAVCSILCIQQTKAAPLVDVSESPVFSGGRHIGVNLPFIYELSIDTRPNKDGMRMSQRVLGRLVNIDMDLTNQNGRYKGPIRVQVGGFTMYDNTGGANNF